MWSHWENLYCIMYYSTSEWFIIRNAIQLFSCMTYTGSLVVLILRIKTSILAVLALTIWVWAACSLLLLEPSAANKLTVSVKLNGEQRNNCFLKRVNCVAILNFFLWDIFPHGFKFAFSFCCTKAYVHLAFDP